MREKNLSTVKSERGVGDRASTKLFSPEPARKKYLTELLQGLASGKLTFADVTGMDRKQMKKVAEQGLVKLKHGRYEEARKIFEVLTFIDDKNYFHHLALAGAYQKLKKNLDAIYQYGECLKYDPENTNALVNRGEIYLSSKNYKKAASDFRAAIQIDKDGRDLFANRARSLVIAIKRNLAAQKGQIKAAEIPISPSRRKKVKPLAILSSAAGGKRGSKFVRKK